MAYLARATLMRFRIQWPSAEILGGATLGATLLAFMGLHWSITVAALGIMALLAAVRPQIMVAVVVLSIPVQSEVMLPFVLGDITFTQLAMFGLVIGWGVIFWRRRIWLDSVVIGFLLVMAAYAVSFIAVDTPSNWFQETYRWAIAGVFYIICRSVISDWRDIRMILWAMLGGVAGVSLLSAYQLVSESGPSHFLVGGSFRVYGSFGTPNTLAAYLEMTIPVLLACIPIAWFVRGDVRTHALEKWLFILVPVGGLAILLLTQSRGGTLGIITACAILWWKMPNRARVPVALAALVIVAGLMLTAPGRSQLERFGELRQETSRELEGTTRSSYDVGSGRGALWETARIMIADKPFTGVGAGEFDENYREYVPSWIDRYPRGQAHNVWLQMGAQAGVLGIIAYAWWFTASVWSVITARRRIADPQRYWLLTGVLAVFAAYTVHSLVDYLNVLSLGLQLSVLTALALNLAPAPLSRYQVGKPPVSFRSSPEVSSCLQ